MKIKLFAAALLSLALAAPVTAQTAPDDLHCFMLSNFFAKAAKDDRSKAVAAQTSLFYLGRLDGRSDVKTMAAIMHSRIESKTAGLQMMACAQRVGRAEQSMHNIMVSAAAMH